MQAAHRADQARLARSPENRVKSASTPANVAAKRPRNSWLQERIQVFSELITSSRWPTGARFASRIDGGDLNVAFKLHYSLKLIIGIGLPRRCGTPVRQDLIASRSRVNPMGDERFQSDRQHEPIAELARLIAQSDTYGERASVGNRFREKIVSDGYNEPPELPPAPQLPVGLNELEQMFERDEPRREDQAHDFDDRPDVAEEGYQNEVQRARRRSLTLLMAIGGLALIGSAGAFGYRDIFGGSALPTVHAINEPNRIAPGPGEPLAKRSDNAPQAGVATAALINKTASPEGQRSTTIVPPKAASRAQLPRQISPTTPAAGQAVLNQAMAREAAAEEPFDHHSTVAAASQRAGKSSAMDVTAALNSEHLVGAPIAANANGAAAITPPSLGKGYAVQISSERSENRAQAAFRSLQSEIPKSA